MRGALQTIAGLTLVLGLLAFGWQVAGRPPVECATVGSGFQAVGAAVELWAVLIVVWRPWLRPRLIKAGSPAMKQMRNLAKRMQKWRYGTDTGPKTVRVGMAFEDSGAGSIKVSGGGSVHTSGGSLESLVNQVHRRLGELEQRVDEVEDKTADRLDGLRTEARRESEETKRALGERIAGMESQAIRVRTNDALRLLLGIFLSLVGAAWSTLC